MDKLENKDGIRWYNSISARIIKRTTILMLWVCGGFGFVAYMTGKEIADGTLKGNLELRFVIITVIFILVGAVSGFFISMDIKKPIRKIMNY
jgi:hypothetical protein